MCGAARYRTCELIILADLPTLNILLVGRMFLAPTHLRSNVTYGGYTAFHFLVFYPPTWHI